MSDHTDIWNPDGGGHDALSEEQLLAYLEGRMSDAERRSVEEALSNEGMESDALEGLHALSSEETQSLKHRLNADLQHALHKKRHTRRGITSQRWTMIAILVILMLALLSYAVIYLAKRS
jgi:anti-sigma factor RsiW